MRWPLFKAKAKPQHKLCLPAKRWRVLFSFCTQGGVGAAKGGLYNACMWVQALRLKGKHLHLEPLTADHASLWAAHHDPQLFAFMSRGGPSDGSVQEYTELIERLNQEPRRVNFAIFVGAAFAGRISFVNIDQDNRSLEIGTFVVKAFQGGYANPESKYLLLKHAFEDLRAIRVQFNVDVRNERSQKAMERLGAVREGVLRKVKKVAGGHMRDSVIYSILDEEWPKVKQLLESRLGY